MEWNHLSRLYLSVLSIVQSPNWALTHLDGTPAPHLACPALVWPVYQRVVCSLSVSPLVKTQTSSPDNKALSTMFLKRTTCSKADVSGEIDEVAQISCCGGLRSNCESPIGFGLLRPAPLPIHTGTTTSLESSNSHPIEPVLEPGYWCFLRFVS